MAELRFLGKRHTVEHLHRLIEEAQKYVILVSPFVRISKLGDLQRAIRAAVERGVAVTLVTNSEALATVDEMGELNQKAVRLFVLNELHAKVYLSEKGALVSSLNLTDASFNRSIEIGIWVPKARPEYSQILAFMRSELQPELLELTNDDDDEFFDDLADADEDDGFCIACKTPIELNRAYPYCRDDYYEWKRHGDRNHTEKFCHECGHRHPATLRKPLCDDCF